MSLFNTKKRQLEKSFKSVCIGAAAVTEHTRNNIKRLYGLHFYTPDEKQELSVSSPDTYLQHSPIHAYLQRVGFKLQEDDAVEPLSPEKARLVLRKSLTDSVAYDSKKLEEVKSSAEADKIVADLFALITEPAKAQFFSISSYFMHDLFFESGLIVADNEKVMYLWFEEKD